MCSPVIDQYQYLQAVIDMILKIFDIHTMHWKKIVCVNWEKILFCGCGQPIKPSHLDYLSGLSKKKCVCALGNLCLLNNNT